MIIFMCVAGEDKPLKDYGKKEGVELINTLNKAGVKYSVELVNSDEDLKITLGEST